MKAIVYYSVMAVLILFLGCNQRLIVPDITPPAPPRNISTSTGDNEVGIFWTRNTEPDVAGYHVLASNAYNGEYVTIGTTSQNYFSDLAAHNGTTYYYAVTAFDYNGNESALSHDVAYDTPRPEGYDVILKNFRSDSTLAGYDFSTYSVGRYDDQYTDVFYENYNGAYYLNVWTDSDIQDMGYTNSLYDIDAAPTAGWSPSKDVRAITGHTYIVWTWDDHYAKIRITAVSSARVEFDWAYQLQSGNVELKHGVVGTRGTLTLGDGAKSRQ